MKNLDVYGGLGNQNYNVDREASAEITGYASIDQPWLKYYNQEELSKEKPKRTVYQEIVVNNEEYQKNLAIEYFGSKINYGTLFKNIDSVSKSFEEYGVKKGDFVTICAAGIPETAYCFYALSKIGAISNMIAPYFDKKELVKRIADCESNVLIVMDTFYGEIKDAIEKSRIKNIIVLPALNSSILRVISKNYKLDKFSNELFWKQFIKDGSQRENSQIVPYEPNLPLSMVYSSGTTSAAKGILLSNDSFQNSVQSYPASGVDITRGQKFYQIIPVWYSTGLSTSLHLPLTYGTSVFMDPRFERDVFVKNILKAKPNYAVAPTSMYEGFLDKKLVGNKSLAFFNYPFEGGEPLRKETAEKIEIVFQEHESSAKLRVAYGQCECGAAITTQTQIINHADGSVGIPLPGIIVGIFDENFNELKYYERGQILTHTPCSMIGYYHNQKATEAYFYTDKHGVKWNCTGDIGYMNEDGELFVQGRVDDYSTINEKRIYNFDIEDVLMALDEIKMCEVFEKTDNNGNNRLVAHIAFENSFYEKIVNDKSLLENELIDLQRELYKNLKDVDMIPSIFKIRSSFPYAKSGKRDIKSLREETDGFILLDVYDLETKSKKLCKPL